MKRYSTAVLLASLVFVGGCIEAAGGRCDGGDQYTNDVFEVAFCHPGHWDQEEGAEGSLVAVLSPRSSAGDTFRENVNLIAEEVGPAMSAQEYAEYSVANAPEFIDDFELLADGTRIVGGLPGYFLEYNGTLDGRPLHWDVVIGVRQGMAFSLTFSADPGARGAFDDDWKTIADSFAYI